MGRSRVRNRKAVRTVRRVATTDSTLNRQPHVQIAESSSFGGRLGRSLLGGRPTSPGRPASSEGACETAPVPFPNGVFARHLDDSRRIKLQLRSGSLREQMAWRAGGLSTTIVDGWAVLRQSVESAATPRTRYGQQAGLTIDAKGVERICLRPAHLQALGLGVGDLLLVAPLLEVNALVVVDPRRLVEVAPAGVRRLATTSVGVDR